LTFENLPRGRIRSSRLKYCEKLNRCPVFRFHTGEETRRLFADLLCHAGGEPHGTDDCAAEVLRLFWQALVGSKERAELRRFVRQYSIWSREVLVRTGIAEEEAGEGVRPPQTTKPGTPFRIRATPFLIAWAGLRKRP
jgi:hypothetical protein